ncbi:MAG: hypothetical protein IJ389_00765 [Clostridia bacterium]|nr:hypothetical protein [Clostridia bacterium]
MRLKTIELTVFAMLGAIMFASKIIMEAAPNIHMLGMLTMVYTVVYRSKALIPIYIYVFLNGLYAGFNQWWLPYLYIWTILWGITMLLPKKMPRVSQMIVYPLLCCLHGLFFGALYAPVQALIFGFDFEQTMAWIAAGLTFDVIHCISNLFMGMLVIPFSALLRKLSKSFI